MLSCKFLGFHPPFIPTPCEPLAEEHEDVMLAAQHENLDVVCNRFALSTDATAKIDSGRIVKRVGKPLQLVYSKEFSETKRERH